MSARWTRCVYRDVSVAAATMTCTARAVIRLDVSVRFQVHAEHILWDKWWSHRGDRDIRAACGRRDRGGCAAPEGNHPPPCVYAQAAVHWWRRGRVSAVGSCVVSFRCGVQGACAGCRVQIYDSLESACQSVAFLHDVVRLTLSRVLASQYGSILRKVNTLQVVLAVPRAEYRPCTRESTGLGAQRRATHHHLHPTRITPP